MAPILHFSGTALMHSEMSPCAALAVHHVFPLVCLMRGFGCEIWNIGKKTWAQRLMGKRRKEMNPSSCVVLQKPSKQRQNTLF